MEKQIFTKEVQAVLDKNYEMLEDERKAEVDAQMENLTDEQKEAIEKSIQQQIALSEIFSQCWDDEDFEAEFKENPKKIMDKFGVEYDDNVDYVVLDNEPKTITYVLPFEGIKEAVSGIADAYKKKVEDVVESKQIIPENWSIKFIQNTEDVNYIVIPMSPENLTPEELEFVSGCGFWSDLWDAIFKEHLVIFMDFFIALQIAAAVVIAAAVASLAVAIYVVVIE